MVVKVFVVDDSAIVRQALAHILAGNAEVELVGSAPNPMLAMEAIRKSAPDVLLLDIEMPGAVPVSRGRCEKSPVLFCVPWCSSIARARR